MFNKFNKFFGFENIGNKIRKIAKILSIVYIIFCALALIGAIITLFSGDIASALLIILMLPLIMILLHIPLWFIYAFGDIYDALCNNTAKEAPSSVEEDNVKEDSPSVKEDTNINE